MIRDKFELVVMGVLLEGEVVAVETEIRAEERHSLTFGMNTDAGRRA